MAGRAYPSAGFLMPGASVVARLEAPGASRYHDGMRAPEPGPSAWPRVSDYAVEPESGQEMLDGEVREALPAGPKHAHQHHRVDYVIGAFVAPDYGADTDLLTRQAIPHNFASDTSIRKMGIDPETGDRYLEELAFEIKSTQSGGDLEKRARIMAARGVRRIFAIPVRGDAAGNEIIAGPVMEWMAAEERWRTYRDDEVIEDPCLFRPLPVRALLDAVEADNAVAQALLAKQNPVLVRHTEEARNEAHQEQTRKILHMHLRERGITLDETALAHIVACDDLDTLERWVLRAAHATSASDIFGDD